MTEIYNVISAEQLINNAAVTLKVNKWENWVNLQWFYQINQTCYELTQVEWLSIILKLSLFSTVWSFAHKS